jgi:hypothetical protein
VEVLWKDAERVFCRHPAKNAEDHRHAFAPILAGAEHPTFESINRLAREYELKGYFDGVWALRPVELVSFGVQNFDPLKRRYRMRAA